MKRVPGPKIAAGVGLLLVGLFILISQFLSSIPAPASSLSPNASFQHNQLMAPNDTAISRTKDKPSFSGAIIVGITRPVSIIGREGFLPAELTLVAGDSITWSNADPQRKLAVLTFQRGREQNQFFNSPALRPGEEWEYVFWNAGEYNYWSTIYGVEGKVIVQPCKNKFCPKK